jgi:hypothetical protein
MRLAQNLRGLATAAKKFHSVASLRASTIHGSDGTRSQIGSSAPASLFGHLPSENRQRIEDFIQQAVGNDPEQQSLVSGMGRSGDSYRQPEFSSISTKPLRLSKPKPELTEILGDFEDEEEVRQFINCCEELASEEIASEDFSAAMEHLLKALEFEEILASNQSALNQTRIQIAYCHLFQHEWRKAVPIALELLEHEVVGNFSQDVAISRLFHALSLAYLSDMEFDGAIGMCRKALQKERALGETCINGVSCLNETFGLMQTIYAMIGDPIRAEVFHRRLPQDFIYEHPANHLDFILKGPDIHDSDSASTISTPRSDSDSLLHTHELAAFWGTLPMFRVEAAPISKKSSLDSMASLSNIIAKHKQMDNDTDKMLMRELDHKAHSERAELDASGSNDSRSNAGLSTKQYAVRPLLIPRRSGTTSSDPNSDSDASSIDSPVQVRPPKYSFNHFSFRKRLSTKRKTSRRYFPRALARLDKWLAGDVHASDDEDNDDLNANRIASWLRQRQSDSDNWSTMGNLESQDPADPEGDARNEVLAREVLVQNRIHGNGLTYEYFGPTALPGPYTEQEYPIMPPLPQFGAPVNPDGPEDIMLSVELGSCSPTTDNHDPDGNTLLVANLRDRVFELDATPPRVELESNEYQDAPEKLAAVEAAASAIIHDEVHDSVRSKSCEPSNCYCSSCIRRRAALSDDGASISGGEVVVPDAQPAPSPVYLTWETEVNSGVDSIPVTDLNQTTQGILLPRAMSNNLDSTSTVIRSEMDDSRRQRIPRSLHNTMDSENYGIITTHIKSTPDDESDSGYETSRINSRERFKPDKFNMDSDEESEELNRQKRISNRDMTAGVENRRGLDREFSFKISEYTLQSWFGQG